MMTKKIFAAVVLIAVMCCGALVASAQSASDNYQDLKRGILELVNKHRTGMGLGPLKMNDDISAAAEKHSHNMAAKKIPFGHDGFDGRMAGLRSKIKRTSGWAENVAYGAETAEQAVEMWLGSPGHKQNIEGKYNLTGIGIAKGKDGQLYYTQIFMNAE